MKAEIVCIIDRSGSMSSIKDDAIGGFNQFIDEQKKIPGEATVTYTQFDTIYEIIYANKPINEVPELNAKTYVPRGMTALHDAVGRTIDEVGARLEKMSKNDRPDKVIIAILTDGHENSSKEYSHNRVQEMIKHQKEKYSWEFIYLGASEDAFDVGISFGLDAKDIFRFAATGQGVRDAYGTMSQTVASYRVDTKGDSTDG